MTPQAKARPTAGAMRAAERVKREARSTDMVEWPAEDIARWIDRETGLPELLSAARQALEYPTAGRTREMLTAAIARAGGER